MQISSKRMLIVIGALLLSGCRDRSIVTVYDKEVTHTPVTCLGLRITPEDKEIRRTLESLYPFEPICKQRLEVTYKSQIVCNSAYNAPQKALSNFPTSYLNMEIRRGFTLQYSYYIDLDHKPDASDIKKGFERIREDLKFDTQ
jgi:hypothetical protein